MKPSLPSTESPAGFPHLNLWAIGILFFLSRMHWMISLHYYSDRRATSAVFVCLAASLALVAAGYLAALVFSRRAFDYLTRVAAIAAFLYFVVIQLRQYLFPSAAFSTIEQVLLAAGGIALAAAGGVWFGGVWRRLLSALVAAALIATTSVFALAAVLARHVELFAQTGANPRPVIVLLLDEFSAGSAEELAASLTRRGLDVGSWPVPSIGVNTIDAIPAIFTGSAVTQARACTPTAICGNRRVVDFGRMRVVRDDVDIVGFYHRYCDIAGLRYCVNTQRGPETPITVTFVCALPLKLLVGAALGCGRTGFDPDGAVAHADAERELFGAPFWSRGGMLYAHLRLPHPPSPGGEVRLADAYAANVARATELVSRVIDRLEQGPSRGEFTVVITSDHHLRSEYWCTVEPYVSNDCALPPSMQGTAVPFIVASRGTHAAHRIPRGNSDVLTIAQELSRRAASSAITESQLHRVVDTIAPP